MILALDLGTSCGVCLRDGNTILMSETWDLSGTRFESAGMKLLRFRHQLTTVHKFNPIKLIAYEEVQRHQSKNPKTKKIQVNWTAAHVYGQMMGELLSFSDQNNLKTTAYPIATIKKNATGKGNANKDAMIKAAKKKWDYLEIKTSDQADALHISQCAYDEFSETLYGEAA